MLPRRGLRYLSVQMPMAAACMAYYRGLCSASDHHSHVRVASEDSAKEAVLYLNNALQVDGSYYRDNDGRWFVYAI